MTNITPNGRPITKSKSAGLDDSVASSVTVNFSFEISWSVVEAGVSVVELEVEEEDELDDSASGSILFFS